MIASKALVRQLIKVDIIDLPIIRVNKYFIYNINKIKLNFKAIITLNIDLFLARDYSKIYNYQLIININFNYFTQILIKVIIQIILNYISFFNSKV